MNERYRPRTVTSEEAESNSDEMLGGLQIATISHFFVSTMFLYRAFSYSDSLPSGVACFTCHLGEESQPATPSLHGGD